MEFPARQAYADLLPDAEDFDTLRNGLPGGFNVKLIGETSIAAPEGVAESARDRKGPGDFVFPGTFTDRGRARDDFGRH